MLNIIRYQIFSLDPKHSVFTLEASEFVCCNISVLYVVQHLCIPERAITTHPVCLLTHTATLCLKYSHP